VAKITLPTLGRLPSALKSVATGYSGNLEPSFREWMGRHATGYDLELAFAISEQCERRAVWLGAACGDLSAPMGPWRNRCTCFLRGTRDGNGPLAEPILRANDTGGRVGDHPTGAHVRAGWILYGPTAVGMRNAHSNCRGRSWLPGNRLSGVQQDIAPPFRRRVAPDLFRAGPDLYCRGRFVAVGIRRVLGIPATTHVVGSIRKLDGADGGSRTVNPELRGLRLRCISLLSFRRPRPLRSAGSELIAPSTFSRPKLSTSDD
jgi:hypothetical protein